jgi:putative oxidoreductase
MREGRAIAFTRRLALPVVAGVLAWAGVTKLADPSLFAVDIANYRLLPSIFAAMAAVYLPWLELCLAAGLLVPRLRAVARWLALGLILVFCAALGSAWVRGLDIRCGCFGGSADGATEIEALARNAVLVGLLVWGGARPARPLPRA